MEKTIGIIYAPIEIENPGQLETLGITWKDVVPLKVGKRTVSVYLVPASEEVSRFMVQELQNKYKSELRSRRCMVKGASGKLVSCPARNSCEDCPLQELEDRRPRVCSLDTILQEGWDCESCEASLQEQAEFREMLEQIGEDKPLSLDVLLLKLEGYTETEIAEELGLSVSAVHRAMVRARNIAKQYME